MKQQLWILNSSLLAIFTIALLVNHILKQEPPVLQIKSIEIEEVEKKKEPIVINLEKIYKQDIFETFTPEEVKPVKQTFVIPIPEPKPPAIAPPPEPKKQEFVSPLNVTIKGIVAFSNELKSVAMITDETGKESVYHIGDKIQDGQVLKIAQNKIVILRANGQQEVFYLRKEEEKLGKISENKWEYIVQKIDEQNFKVDPEEFTQEVSSLGELIEDLSLCSAYQQGNIIGIRIGNVDPNEIGAAIGLQKNDIIVSINDLNTNDIKNRIDIYDSLLQKKKGDTIKVVLKRADQDVTLNYKLEKIKKATIQSFTSTGEGETTTQELKMSREQEREKYLREFEKQHKAPKQNKVISDIRKRLLENMKTRARNRRVR
jgi:type II secretion system protein C